MINDKIKKALKILIGIILILKGLDFINLSLGLYQQVAESKKHAYICTFVGVENPTNYLFPGLYILLFGILLIYSVPMLLKTLISYSLIMPVYFLFYFVLFSIITLDINISADFVNKIFICLGMFYLTTLISHYNNFNWKTQIKHNYKLLIIIGIVLTATQFYWTVYY